MFYKISLVANCIKKCQFTIFKGLYRGVANVFYNTDLLTFVTDVHLILIYTLLFTRLIFHKVVINSMILF